MNDHLKANQSRSKFCRDQSITNKFERGEVILIIMNMALTLVMVFPVLAVSSSRYILVEIEDGKMQSSQMRSLSAMGTWLLWKTILLFSLKL